MKQDDRAFAVLATDIAILSVDDAELKVFLTKAKSKSFEGIPTLPGGLVGFEERTLDAVKRILKNVLTSTDFYCEQLYTFDDPKRDPLGRVVSVAYLMLIPWNKARVIVKGDADWVSVKKLPKLAYDHNKITKSAVDRLTGKLTYTNIVMGLMPEEFTLTELQSVYENILGRELDKRNFRKKINSLKILKKLSKKRKGEKNRPAQLYSFSSKNLEEVEII
jgi:8-oxo-dGTP diphosphatase